MKIYYVYRLTCTHAGAVEKYYYGCRSCHGNPVTDDYWSSSRYVAAARARFGPASWTKKVIAIYTSREVALAHEARLHQRLNVKDHPLFFNRANQTSSGFAAPSGPMGAAQRANLAVAQQARWAALDPAERALSADHKARIAEGRRASYAATTPEERAHTPTTKAKIGEGRRGHVHSPETRAKMTENHRGMRRMRHSEAAKAKIAAANRGKVMSTEARAKIAAANRGKVVSNETKAKMAEAQRQRWAVKRDAKRAINVEAGEGADGGEPAPRVMGQRT